MLAEEQFKANICLSTGSTNILVRRLAKFSQIWREMYATFWARTRL